MNYRLPSGNTMKIDRGRLILPAAPLSSTDCAQIVRLFLTEWPLEKNDPRLALVEEIRVAVVKELPRSGRFFVLDALRSISLKKLRGRRRT